MPPLRLPVVRATIAIAAAAAFLCIPGAALAVGPEPHAILVGMRHGVVSVAPVTPDPSRTEGVRFSMYMGLINKRLIVRSRSGQFVYATAGCRRIRFITNRGTVGENSNRTAAVCPAREPYPEDPAPISSIDITGTEFDDAIAMEYPRLFAAGAEEREYNDHDGAICLHPEELDALKDAFQFFCNIRIEARQGDDEIWGGYHRETIYGGRGSDRIYGRQMGDEIYGDGPGEDDHDFPDHVNRIEGGAGGDTIRGGSGQNVIIGGTGSDTIFGGTGPNEIRAREQRLTWPVTFPGSGGLSIFAKPEVDSINCSFMHTIFNRAHYNDGSAEDLNDPGLPIEQQVYVSDVLLTANNCPPSTIVGNDVVKSNQLLLPVPDFHEGPSF